MNTYKTIQTMLLGLYAVLWLGGVVSYVFLGGPPADAAWTGPMFLETAALLALMFSRSAEWPMLLVCALLGFVAEVLGVTYGIPFGNYQYTATLFPRILGVPLVMAAAWLVLFAYTRQMVRNPFAAAAWMTAIDFVIDPLAANNLGFWKWENPGPYYGIPWSNFAGWYVVSIILFSLARKPAVLSRRVAGLGLSVVAFFTAIALGAGFVLPGIVGLGLIVLHLAMAFRQGRQSAQSIASGPQD